ncbi:FecR family protein [Algibacter sp.]|nr:FecR family protein [Algibacter sp.]MDB4273812.1 FecR family protein [Algibacter sp.]
MISSLITKHLNGEATEQEVSQVFNWIEDSEENKKQFIEFKKTWSMSCVSDSEKTESWKKIKEYLAKTKPFQFYSIFKYAAILILFISVGSIILLSQKQDAPEIKNVVLELEETNTKIDLTTDKAIIKKQLVDVITLQNAHEIVYNKESVSQPITYNTLNIPFGKTFKVTLSDGSIVHLNAGSSLKYPQQFNTTGNRKVFLQGEAFFKVNKDEKRPFIVEANDIEIKVLGTEFNVNTSSLNHYADCVLVEGSVLLSNNNGNEVILSPNEKATWDITSKAFNTSQVNTKLYTSWVHGELIFEDSNFSDISNKLTQFYNIKIENRNNSLKTQKFSGTISLKHSSVENILDLLINDTPFSYIKKDDNTIIISNN